jgi:mannose-6-phosphate isomerase
MNPCVLVNPVRPYAWGSRDFIATLQGRPAPSAMPEAELWMGAHPLAPSQLEEQGRHISLDARIAAEPVATLGPDVATRFSGELPFLMKVLAAAQPLSLQVHPDRAQAEAGFEAEERHGIPLSAPTRCYKDRHHKPELIVALTPFVALCGFRSVAATKQRLDEWAIPGLESYATALDPRAPTNALRTVFERLLTAERATQQTLVDAVRQAAGRSVAAGWSPAEAEWIARLGDLYPGDIGVVCALFLNLVFLQPGEALYLPAGNLHAYLDGAGVEVMASSDNVLRGGLTPKFVNVPELMHILKFDELEPTPLHATDGGEGGGYPTPAEEFELSRVELREGAGRAVTHSDRLPRSGGPEIWLVTEGHCRLTWPSGSLELPRGSSVFIPADVPSYHFSGIGELFGARVPVAR